MKFLDLLHEFFMITFLMFTAFIHIANIKRMLILKTHTVLSQVVCYLMSSLYVIFKMEKYMFNPTNKQIWKRNSKVYKKYFVLAHWNHITENTEKNRKIIHSF